MQPREGTERRSGRAEFKHEASETPRPPVAAVRQYARGAACHEALGVSVSGDCWGFSHGGVID